MRTDWKGSWGVLVAVFCAVTQPALADDWPAYLGPHQDGTSRETGLALAWGEAGPPILWRKSLGESFSPPVVARARLIAFHRIGDEAVV